MAKRINIPPRKYLIEAWTDFYGEPPPKGLSTRLLHMACAYNEQIQEHGELKDKTLRDVNGLSPQTPIFSASRLAGAG